MEQEADEFAASLLMPLDLFRSAVKNYRQRVCILSELCELAEKRLHTSITSTALRYCQADIEACSVVFSENGKIKWAAHSEDMKRLGMGFIPFGTKIPAVAQTAKLVRAMADGQEADPVEGSTEPSVWYERPFYHKLLWEEAMPLGSTGIVLTYLTLKDPQE